MNDAYKNLAKHLNNLPGGFPETENGVEYRILKRLFTHSWVVLLITHVQNFLWVCEFFTIFWSKSKLFQTIFS